MNDSDFIRYSRQILIQDIAITGQQKLLNSKVIIIGLGGLGSPAALYLAGAGVGTIIIMDYDEVNLSDLQRQILFTNKNINESKVQIACNRLQDLNPTINIIALNKKLQHDDTLILLRKQIIEVDIVLDCTDNIKTRQIINSICVSTDTPLITASAIGFNGQIMVITPPWSKGCYHCLWPSLEELDYNCSNFGILGPVVGVMGTLQALEAIKLLNNIEEGERNKLQLFDAHSNNWHKLELKKSNSCSVCRKNEL